MAEVHRGGIGRVRDNGPGGMHQAVTVTPDAHRSKKEERRVGDRERSPREAHADHPQERVRRQPTCSRDDGDAIASRQETRAQLAELTLHATKRRNVMGDHGHRPVRSSLDRVLGEAHTPLCHHPVNLRH